MRDHGCGARRVHHSQDLSAEGREKKVVASSRTKFGAPLPKGNFHKEKGGKGAFGAVPKPQGILGRRRARKGGIAVVSFRRTKKLR